MENVNKEDFFNLVKKAESEYFAKRPCHFCVGNGCDDCRDCKDAETDHQMWLEVKKLKDEFKEKFGVSYETERDIRFEYLVKKKQKKDALEEVYKRCTIEEIIDYGIKNGKTDKLVNLEDVCKFLDEHLYTGTSTGDYDYGQEYIYSDFDNASDLIFALRKAMKE